MWEKEQLQAERTNCASWKLRAGGVADGGDEDTQEVTISGPTRVVKSRCPTPGTCSSSPSSHSSLGIPVKQ